MSSFCALLLVLLACGDPQGLIDEEGLERLTQEALAALDAGADIRLPEPVEVLLLTTDEARERRAAYARELGEEAGLTVSIDLMSDLVFADAMLGRYLPDEKVIYILEDVLIEQSGSDRAEAREELFAVLAHELVHAYDDQVYGVLPGPAELEVMIGDPARLPELQALMGLLEGRATHASELACAHAGRRPLPTPTLESARRARMIPGDGSATGDLLAGMANGLAQLKLVQYAYGIEFAREAHAFGGEPFFDQVFAHLPLSLAELEDFGLFRLRWAEEMAAAMEAEEAAATDPPGADPP